LNVIAEEAFVEIKVDEPLAEQLAKQLPMSWTSLLGRADGRVNRLVERIRLCSGLPTAPVFPRRLLEMIGENAKIDPDFGRDIFDRLRGSYQAISSTWIPEGHLVYGELYR
jgi:hypothetical protein